MEKVVRIGVDKDSILIASRHLVFADLSSDTADSVVILNLTDGVYYELTEVGTRVWNLIQQPCSIRFLLDKLLEEYEVDAERCEEDLLALARNLAKCGLVEVRKTDVA
jgi:hypothetical protein